jgi:hypothetical protein
MRHLFVNGTVVQRDGGVVEESLGNRPGTLLTPG